MQQTKIAQEPPVLKELTCPNCGSPLSQHTPGTQTVICSKCGSYVALAMEGPTSSGAGPRIPPPPVPMKLGQQATLAGISAFVLGRVLYEGWDDEDRWRWTEWLLGSADGRLFWLSYDDEDGFVLFNKLRIREEFKPEVASAIPLGDGKKAWVKERYPARILAAEGELTWKATPGERLYMVEGASSNKKYSVQHTSAEIELYEGTPLKETEVAAALNDNVWLQRIKRSANTRQLLNLIGVLCLIFAGAGVGFAIGASSTGTLAASGDLRINATNPVASLPVEFDQEGRPAIIKLTMQGSPPANTWAELDVSVIAPDESETFIFDGEFWHETGSDDGGPWSEQSTTSSDMFVPYRAGLHKLEVALGEYQTLSDVAFHVEVYKNHIMPAWLVGYGLVAAVLGAVLMLRGGGSSVRTILTIIVVVIVAIIFMVIVATNEVDLGSIIGDILDEM